MDCPIERFAIVDSDLCRGARPDDQGMKWLVETAGVKTVINLEWEESDVPALGVVEVRLVDWEPLPSVAPLIEDRHIRSVLTAIREAQKPVFLHCYSGQNRTGVAVAAYRIVIKGEQVDSVVTDMKSFGGIWSGADEAYVRSLGVRKDEFS